MITKELIEAGFKYNSELTEGLEEQIENFCESRFCVHNDI